jgi:signal transduction histidine kinase
MPNDADLEQRLCYLNLDPEDGERLAALRPMIEAQADDLVSAFYRHLLAFEPTRALLADPQVKERLLQKQREYLLHLVDPVIDQAYVSERRRIGEAHFRLGLEPRWYLGAYSLYFSLLIPTVAAACGDNVEEERATLAALYKRLTLDTDLAMDAYAARREERLEYVADELATEGRRLARDLESERATLRQTVERAEAAEELASIATLVAGLAHEIGTPMGVIQGHAKLLEPAVQGEDATWRLRTIQEQIGRISRIIQTLLNMARPRKSQRAPVALDALLENTIAFIAEKLRLHQIEVDMDLRPTPSVLGDAERLQQLFLNILINAVDAMDDGGRLSVSLRHSDGETASVCVAIRDDGRGIPPEHLEQIFDPFFTTKPAGEGNGLGLMVCRGIASDHGGSIEVESTPSRGTRFEVRLPIPSLAS